VTLDGVRRSYGTDDQTDERTSLVMRPVIGRLHSETDEYADQSLHPPSVCMWFVSVCVF